MGAAANPGLDLATRHATRAASNEPGAAPWEDLEFDRGDPLPFLSQKGGYAA